MGRIAPRSMVLISIPKKTVPLAVRRNRLKRLIREATRKHAAFSGVRIYSFRVLSAPEKGLGLGDVQNAIEKCLARQAGA
ncbi:MAG: ribonuclease P protein component [Candidatus Omnitrophota bacterium]